MGRRKMTIKGQENYNNFGSKMIVKEDRGALDIDVYFPEYNWISEHKTRQSFNNGEIRCPYEITVYNIGYIGDGEYKTKENGKDTRCFKTWSHMLERCYSSKYHKKYPTYIGCTVCEEWHNFQNFAKWYYENYYQIGNEKMCLDKDILIKGNRVYSPETCIFVPNRINVLFVKSDKIRGEYPIGVSYDRFNDNLVSLCNNGKGKQIRLGIFSLNQVEEAFYAYKIFKENIIKQVAEEYRELIPEKLYNALINYEVEITD